MTKTRALPKFILPTLARLNGGALLCAEFSPISGNLNYFTHPDEKPVTEAVAKRLLALGLVEPQGDAMFDAASQTYRVRMKTFDSWFYIGMSLVALALAIIQVAS